MSSYSFPGTFFHRVARSLGRSILEGPLGQPQSVSAAAGMSFKMAPFLAVPVLFPGSPLGLLA